RGSGCWEGLGLLGGAWGAGRGLGAGGSAGLRACGRGAGHAMGMPNPTAAMLVIGDEILSGRTRDANAHHLAGRRTAVGSDLEEIRVVPDVHEVIVRALGALRETYTHVFTSGGIGPTHDDITADAVAATFDVGID